MGYGDNTLFQAGVFNYLKEYHVAASHDPAEISKWGTTWKRRVWSAEAALKAEFGSHENFLNGEPKPTAEETKLILKRLFNEIPVEGFIALGEGGGFLIPMQYIQELEEGDPLLYK